MKIDYTKFFNCPENKAAYITAKYGIPYEELRQFFIYVVAHWNRTTMNLNVGHTYKAPRERVTKELIKNIKKQSSIAEGMCTIYAMTDKTMLELIYDIMDF